MTVGLLVLDCFLPGCLSLKDKRQVLRSLVDRTRREFNVSICEVEFQDQWQRSRLAAVTANTEWPMAQKTLNRIIGLAENDHRLNVLDSEIRQLC